MTTRIVCKFKESIEREKSENSKIATVKEALITPSYELWAVKVKGVPDLEVPGNIFDHKCAYREGRDYLAEGSWMWFRLRGS